MSWYLDAVTNKDWHGVIINDYEYIMPVYIKKKSIFPYITQPFLCQRCGPYPCLEGTGITLNELLNVLPGFFLKAAMNVCTISTPDISGFKIFHKTNQFLPLDKPYSQIFESYNRSTRRNLAASKNTHFEITEKSDPKILFDFLIENDHTGILEKHSESLHILMQSAEKNAEVICQSAYLNNEMIGGGFYILFNNRIYWLVSAVNETGRNTRVMFSMVNRLIEKYSGQQWVFDFCGSSIQNVAQRNSGFGAIEENYYHLVKKGTIF